MENFTYELFDFEIKIDHNGNISVTNNTGLLYRVSFHNPITKFHGYVNFNFMPGHWVATNPKEWPTDSTQEPIEIILTGKDHQYIISVNQKEKTISDITDKFIYVENYSVLSRKVSFIISVYQTQDYIDELIKKILLFKRDYLEMEILIGIDCCKESLKFLSSQYYDEEVKIYFFNENIGSFVIRNTLITKSKYNNLIFIDSDDLPHENLLKIFFENISNYDFVSWANYSFNEGDDYTQESNLTYNHAPWGCYGLKKDKIMLINGFVPWRCNADDELTKRWTFNNFTAKFIDEVGYYYRIRNKSLSRDDKTRNGSMLRESYIDIMQENNNNCNWPNPDRLYIADSIRIR